MPQMTFMELIRKVLEEEQRPLSPAEIWQIAQAKGYDKSLASHAALLSKFACVEKPA